MLERVKAQIQKSRGERIQRLQTDILQSEYSLGEEHCAVTHHFAPGVYCRDMHIPAGTVVVGKRHRHTHPCIISKGRVHVFTEADGLVEMQAPLTFIAGANTKRVILALEDTVWTTVHCTDSTDLADIEREVIIPENT